MFDDFCVKGPTNLKCPSHINPEMEIVYVKSGNIEVNYGRESVRIEPGKACIVFPFSVHQFQPSKDIEAYVLMFPYSIYEALYLKYRDKLPSDYGFAIAPEAVVYIDSLIRRWEELKEYEVYSLYYAFMSAFFRQNTFNKTSNNGLMRKLMSVVDGDVLENITLKNVAMQLDVSETFLSAYLKKQTGMKFRDLVNGILISKAVQLLLHTNESITTVAHESGFGSLRSFNRIFVKVMGCTPLQYRKNKKK